MDRLEDLRAGRLAGAQRLKLADGLTTFPHEILQLADTLEVLDLSGNRLSSLPDALPRLQRLRILFCSDNDFTELPAVLGRCPQLEMVGFKANRIATVPGRALPARLRWLILTDNRIETLPDEIGRCGRLQKLMLAGNRLRTLPAGLADCRRLELLRISANRFEALPDWLMTMPRLAWLAFGGNPFCTGLEDAALTQDPIAVLDWADLQAGEQLGEGASGVIQRAVLRGELPQAVAVKRFKAAVTSDGLPHSEMAACVHAGAHPNLVPVLGKLADHPDGAAGLVMALIPPAFRNLAGPPSMASCTRDVYADGIRFTPQQALSVAHGVASVATHLHARGLMHGDLYAHNILHDGEGRALLGDFGAASFYQRDDFALERIEVRAFGCLLEELVERCAWPSDLGEALDALTDACLAEVTALRPPFAHIERRLAALAAMPCGAAPQSA